MPRAERTRFRRTGGYLFCPRAVFPAAVRHRCPFAVPGVCNKFPTPSTPLVEDDRGEDDNDQVRTIKCKTLSRSSARHLFGPSVGALLARSRRTLQISATPVKGGPLAVGCESRAGRARIKASESSEIGKILPAQRCQASEVSSPAVACGTA